MVARRVLDKVSVLHPQAILDDLITTKGELAAANRTIAHMSTALATAHSALLAGEFERAMQIILITIDPRGRT